MAKKKIELEDLARMTQQGFLEMGKNFVEMNKKMIDGFHSVNKRLSGLEKDVTEIKFHMTEMVRRSELLALEQRVEKLEKIFSKK